MRKLNLFNIIKEMQQRELTQEEKLAYVIDSRRIQIVKSLKGLLCEDIASHIAKMEIAKYDEQYINFINGKKFTIEIHSWDGGVFMLGSKSPIQALRLAEMVFDALSPNERDDFDKISMFAKIVDENNNSSVDENNNSSVDESDVENDDESDVENDDESDVEPNNAYIDDSIQIPWLSVVGDNQRFLQTYLITKAMVCSNGDTHFAECIQFWDVFFSNIKHFTEQYTSHREEDIANAEFARM